MDFWYFLISPAIETILVGEQASVASKTHKHRVHMSAGSMHAPRQRARAATIFQCGVNRERIRELREGEWIVGAYEERRFLACIDGAS